jgi:hypothetical protein
MITLCYKNEGDNYGMDNGMANGPGCGGKANYPWVMGLLDGHSVSSKVQILQMQKTPLRIELIIMIKIQFFAGEVWTPRHCIHQKKKKKKH